MANNSLTILTNRFFALVLKAPIQMGWLSIINSVTNISRLGTFKARQARKLVAHRVEARRLEDEQRKDWRLRRLRGRELTGWRTDKLEVAAARAATAVAAMCTVIAGVNKTGNNVSPVTTTLAIIYHGCGCRLHR